MSSEVKTQVVGLPDGFGGGEHAEVVLATDYAALEAKYERLRLKVMVWNDGKPYAALKAERDAMAAELLALKARMAEPVAWARRADLDDPSDCLFVSRYEYLATGYSVALYAAPPAASSGQEKE